MSFGYIRHSRSFDNNLSAIDIISFNNFDRFIEYIYIQSSIPSYNIILMKRFFLDRHEFGFFSIINVTLSSFLPGHQIDFPTFIAIDTGLFDDIGAITPTLPGESYISNGIYGVIVFMSIYGIISCLLYNFLLRNRCYSNLLLHSYWFYVMIISINGGILSAGSRFFYGFLICSIIIILSKNFNAWKFSKNKIMINLQ
jgi:hypothetical protein